jgi:hypothetical protein
MGTAVSAHLFAVPTRGVLGDDSLGSSSRISSSWPASPGRGRLTAVPSETVALLVGSIGRIGVLRGGRPSADGRGFLQRQPEFFPHVSVMSRWGGIGTTDGPGATKGGYGLRRTPSVLLPSVLPHDGRDLPCGRECSAAGLVPSAAWSAVGARERAKSDRSPEPAA